MSSFKKYFSYHFRSTFIRLIIMVGIALLLTFTFSSFEVHEEISYDYSTDPRTQYPVMYAGGSMTIIAYVATVVTLLLPILELIPFKNKRNMDTLLTLPITRGKMIFAHYLNGLAHIAIVLLSCFTLIAIKMIPYAFVFEIWMLIPFYLMLLLTCAIIYSLFTFVFAMANTIADGIVWLHIYPILPALMLLTLYVWPFGEINTDSIEEFLNPLYCTPFYHFITVLTKYESYITPTIRYDVDEGLDKIYSISCTEITFESGEIFSLVIWVFIAIACVAGLIFFFGKQRPENIGGISDSPFGYMTLIPLMAATLVLFRLMTVLVMIFVVVWYIVYRRGFRFKIPDLVVIGVTFFASIFVRIVAA